MFQVSVKTIVTDTHRWFDSHTFSPEDVILCIIMLIVSLRPNIGRLVPIVPLMFFSDTINITRELLIEYLGYT